MRSVFGLRRIDALAAPPIGAQAPLFVATIVTSLLTALLWALVPMGLPATSSHGSAFSPSTTAVSLSAPSAARVAGKRVQDDGDRSGQATPSLDHLVVTVGSELAVPPISAPPLLAPFVEANLPATPPRGAAWPRAPPQG